MTVRWKVFVHTRVVCQIVYYVAGGEQLRWNHFIFTPCVSRRAIRRNAVFGRRSSLVNTTTSCRCRRDICPCVVSKSLWYEFLARCLATTTTAVRRAATRGREREREGERAVPRKLPIDFDVNLYTISCVCLMHYPNKRLPWQWYQLPNIQHTDHLTSTIRRQTTDVLSTQIIFRENRNEVSHLRPGIGV